MNITAIIGEGRTQLVRYRLDDSILRCKRYSASTSRETIEKDLNKDASKNNSSRPGKRKTQRSKKTDMRNSSNNHQE